MKSSGKNLALDNTASFAEIVAVIERARENAFRAVNRELIDMYWEIGHRISERSKSAGWGKSVVTEFSSFVQSAYVGIKGFSPAKTDEAWEFYLLLSAKNGYSKRELERQLDSALFERTMISTEVNKDIFTQSPGLNGLRDSYGKIQRFDVSVAKNYLDENEMLQLTSLVSASLDMTELQALRQIPMTMADWEERLNRFLASADWEILKDAGKV